MIVTDKYIKIQNELSNKISLVDTFQNFKTICGVDLAYWNDKAVCCLVVLDYNGNIIDKAYYSNAVSFPYKAGFLSFRELPFVLEAVKKLNVEPCIFMFDDNGILHPRKMGLATHASFFLNKPTIGVAKSYYKIDKKTNYIEPDNKIGSYTNISINNFVYGRCLRTRLDTKPIFVSCGNYISLDTSCKIVMHYIRDDSRIPLPTRYADIETHKMRKQLKNN